MLRLLDLHIQKQAQLQVIRVVDDICYCEDAVKAWQAIQTFCDAFGL
ncbi:hypothetical protein [Candidatus Parabeggiatoa sp. HSG14]